MERERSASMEELEAKRRREENSLFLHKLPKLARNEVIRSMGYKEWILLAVTSKRMEECVRSAKIPIHKIAIYFRNYLSHIILDDCSITLLCTNDVPQLKKGEGLGKTELEPWMNKEPCSEVENIAAVFKRIQNIFLCKQINLCIGSNFSMKTTFKELLSIFDLKKWKYLKWMNKEINLEDWNYLMEGANLKQAVSFCHEIPPNFKHENAFKFLINEYEDARWVQIEDLFSLKNCWGVLLGQNNFTSEQLKMLIKYWVKSDVDMFNWLRIKNSEPAEVIQLLKGFLVLEHTVKQTSPTYFVLAKTQSKTRKKPVLCIRFAPTFILLTALAPMKPFLGGDGGSYGKEYEFLKLQRNKKILEKKLRKNKQEMQEVQKAEIRAKIQELRRKMRGLGARYIRGKWKIRT